MCKNNLYRTNRHSCYLLEYHLVVVTKYRHPVLKGAIKVYLLDQTKQSLIHGIALLKLSIPTWTISTFCLRPHHKYNYPNWLTIIKLLLLDLFVKTLVSNSNSIIGSHIFGAIVTLCVAFRTEQNRL